MKRSEASEIIADEIDNVIDDYIPWSMLIKGADSLLTKLEDVGMLPPKTPIESLGDGDYYGGTREWEPEDEQK